ncbi:hypothetical protein E1B28_001398 [Marasmius oreades]|uniref:SH3 domain-containing protein n=1 Tax=Marasmius oreades TaxID=181124 RepID=A0A9P8AF48_9AGAR|nr:uncharacterized protein E1B28_001398 [Marasmius oreades]KAG7099566.1 hypothetical protein E1B28_001398 [Marasmius oreades]
MEGRGLRRATLVLRPHHLQLLMKFNTPIPQPLPKECDKAAKIFQSFVDQGNNGLDGVIPRELIENAKGFAIFTIFKAGFVFSARAGSGIVIAKLPNGSWSAPSAIGLAGLGVGGQLGAEMTDFLVVLNSRSALRSFIAAGSLTLGGNASIAVGPLGRNGEATGALNTNGKVAAMYSYSKTRGLFGGLSIEGSVIVERQDANIRAYKNDIITVQQLLGGAIEPPAWTSNLVKTLEACTGMPGPRRWVSDERLRDEGSYAFSGLASPNSTPPPTRKLKRGDKPPFPPTSWGQPKDSGGYFSSDFDCATPSVETDSWQRGDTSATSNFETRFETDFAPSEVLRKHKRLSSVNYATSPRDPIEHSTVRKHYRSASLASPAMSYPPLTSLNPFEASSLVDVSASDNHTFRNSHSTIPQTYISPKPELAKPLNSHEGVGRAIALYDFNAVESGDLAFKKGDVITIVRKSDSTDDWWIGKIGCSKGIFPANFVEVV